MHFPEIHYFYLRRFDASLLQVVYDSSARYQHAASVYAKLGRYQLVVVVCAILARYQFAVVV